MPDTIILLVYAQCNTFFLNISKDFSENMLYNTTMKDFLISSIKDILIVVSGVTGIWELAAISQKQPFWSKLLRLLVAIICGFVFAFARSL